MFRSFQNNSFLNTKRSVFCFCRVENSHVYTNHSVRTTAITLWANAGLTNREIMAISGHRSESSLQSYHNMPSAHQLRKCSDVLSLALGEDQSNEQTPNQLVVRPPLQQLQVPSINTSISTNQQSTSEFKQLFYLCTIGNVNVYNYKPLNLTSWKTAFI